MAGLRDWADRMTPRAPEILWEEDFDAGLTDEEWDALYGRRVA